jgi:hypothetical protein
MASPNWRKEAAVGLCQVVMLLTFNGTESFCVLRSQRCAAAAFIVLPQFSRLMARQGCGSTSRLDINAYNSTYCDATAPSSSKDVTSDNGSRVGSRKRRHPL